MKKGLCYLLILLSHSLYSQLQQIFTGTTDYLDHVSVRDGVVLIGSRNKYLARSYDGGETLLPLTDPSPPGYWKTINRLDSSNIFLHAYSIGGGSKIYFSNNGGLSWRIKLDEPELSLETIGFFDTLNGIGLAVIDQLLKFGDGGANYSTYTTTIRYGSLVQTSGDSTVCFGGSTGWGTGAFYLSTDRGQNTGQWITFIGTTYPVASFFLNRDTIFVLSATGELMGTFDGGKNWKNELFHEHFLSSSVHFVNNKEGYIAGSTTDSIGAIYRTTDLGKNWQRYNTGVKTLIRDMAFLNDSTALLVGSGGILLKWNVRGTLFTSITENNRILQGFKIFPNPVKGKLHFQFSDQNPVQEAKIELFTPPGQLVLSQICNGADTEADVSLLPAGIYYLRVHNSNGTGTYKIIIDH